MYHSPSGLSQMDFLINYLLIFYFFNLAFATSCVFHPVDDFPALRGRPRSIVTTNQRHLGHTSSQTSHANIIMAAANLEEVHLDASVFIFSDSYLNFGHLSTTSHINENGVNAIRLDPHEFVLGNGQAVDRARMYNYSRGGCTMNMVLSNAVNISIWANNLPAITLLHVGACDIANEDIGRVEDIRKQFPVKYINFLEQLKARGRNAAFDKEVFDAKLEQHKWLVVGVADWGWFGDGYYAHSLNDADYFEARRLANDGLRANRKGLWQNHKAVLLFPAIERPVERNLTPNDVHLYGNTAWNYGNTIFKTMARLICPHCQLRPKYLEDEHKKEFLLGLCKKSQQEAAGASA